ncbi:hypothetical protein GCM10010170_042550 [Dactylosporangium salmoneum]|uniref:Pentapeptide repeat-containing protein n=2 Tax=Dactylosporangium salmoneum TaxID=53361 RepID=A0ABN3GJV4_9ACTN
MPDEYGVRVVDRLAGDWVVVDREHLVGESFAGRRMIKFAAIGSTFERCSFAGVVCADASLGSGLVQSEYRECVFDGAKLRLPHGGIARFVDCSFRNVDLRSWECGAVELIGCVFTGTLRSGWFWYPVPQRYIEAIGREYNTIVDNDFRGLRMTGFYFRGGVDLSRQQLPDSPDYLYMPDGPAAVAAVEAELPDCPEPLRRPAARLLSNVQDMIDEGQQQIWLRRKEFIGPDLEPGRWVLNILDRFQAR